jgi:hypothetical protein
MTSAARPTYFAAVGKQEIGGFRSQQVSQKDQAAHTHLKYRQLGQHTQEETKNVNLKEVLATKEAEFISQKNKSLNLILQEEKKVDVPLLLKAAPEVDEEKLKKYDDSDREVESDDGFDSSRCVILF